MLRLQVLIKRIHSVFLYTLYTLLFFSAVGLFFSFTQNMFTMKCLFIFQAICGLFLRYRYEKAMTEEL